MLFGVALATPPASAAPGTPAAAAVVASRDRSLGRFSSRVLLQPWVAEDAGKPHQLAVQGLRGAVKELLIDFYRCVGAEQLAAFSHAISKGLHDAAACHFQLLHVLIMTACQCC
jgi:hypothetical protein